MAGISERRASATRVATQKQALLSRETVDESAFLSHIPSDSGARHYAACRSKSRAAAQAGGKKPEKIGEMIAKVPEIVGGMLK